MVNREVFTVYRLIARAGRRTFDGDEPARRALAVQLREKFEANRNETDPAKIAKALKVGQQVATILSRNIVQGVRQPGSDTFQLKLDKDRHEINDNPPVKKCG